MPAEIARLKTEIVRLEKQNLHSSDGDAQQPSNSNPSAEADAQTSQRHADELEALRTAHDTALKSLRASLTAELESVKSELDGHRSRSHQLDGVESKIEAVQRALRDAQQNEQELQQEVKEKAQDRDQLAKVVEELEQEIDRCQLKLDEDSRLQAHETEESRRMAEQLQKSLEEEQQRCRAAADKAEKISTELAEGQERFNNEMKDLRERNEQETEELRAAAADADRLREEVTAAQESSERSRKALEESASTIKALEENIERLENQNAVQLESLREQLQQAQTVEADLRNARERENIEKRKLERSAEQDLRTTREELDSSRKEAKDRERTIERLEQQLLEIQNAESELRNARERDDTEKQKLAHTTEQELRNCREELGTIREEARDREQTIERLQHDISNLEQQSRESQDQNKINNAQHSALVAELQAKLQHSEKLFEDMTVDTNQKSHEYGTLAADLQSKIVKLQQDYEDISRTSTETIAGLQTRIEQLKQEGDSAKSTVEELAAGRSDDQRAHETAVEDMIMKLQASEQATEAARSRCQKIESELSQAMESLQDETQTLQQHLHDEQSLRARDVEELQRLRGRHDELENEQSAFASQSSAERSALEARTTELSQLLSGAEDREKMATEKVTEAQSELSESRDLILKLRNELEEEQRQRGIDLSALEDEMNAKLRDLKEIHAKELGQTRKDLETELNATQANIQSLLDEKRALERQLGEIHMQHNRELEEEAQKHSASYRELQENYKQLRSNQQIRDQGQHATSEAMQEELRGIISTLREEHQRAMSELRRIEDQSQESERVRANLQTSLEELKAEHQKAAEEMSDEHTRRMVEVSDAHAAELAKIEKLAADRAVAVAMSEAKEHHERASAAMATEHRDKMQQMAESIAEVEAAAIREAGRAAEEQAREHDLAMRALEEKYESTTAALHAEIAILRNSQEVKADAASLSTQTEAGLSHVFVNHDHNPEQHAEPSSDDVKDCDRSNTLDTTVSHFSSSETAPPSIAAYRVYEEDPFRSPIHDSTATGFAHAAQDSAVPVVSGTIEGTLESLRMQTEQLLEINNDFLNEQRRWSGRLGLRYHDHDRHMEQTASPIGTVS